MGRQPRRWSESGFYHVVTRGNARQRLFHDEDDYRHYLRLTIVALTAATAALYHYCLMPNHTHVLLGVPQPELLSRAMHQLQRRYFFHMRRKYRLTGHLFQGRYHSFPIESDSYLLECGRYIERNPLQAGLVSDVADYLWSSYPWYASGRSREVVLTPSPSYLAMGETPQARQAAYRPYVSTTRPYDRAMSQHLSEATVGV